MQRKKIGHGVRSYVGGAGGVKERDSSQPFRTKPGSRAACSPVRASVPAGLGKHNGFSRLTSARKLQLQWEVAGTGQAKRGALAM